ncbi:hypothetical protein RvY_12416 [Ramazzottius varieornatus]|uniref:Uncharacterized protein n=1 Tax=Ramazzottius varieornatus TaxID=947166 RepID=A0A1D1VJF6_RAMVA|nr:hypothetical protein RvY_12416 [Ramazzottius varieornatus]
MEQFHQDGSRPMSGHMARYEDVCADAALPHSAGTDPHPLHLSSRGYHVPSISNRLLHQRRHEFAITSTTFRLVLLSDRNPKAQFNHITHSTDNNKNAQLKRLQISLGRKHRKLKGEKNKGYKDKKRRSQLHD